MNSQEQRKRVFERDKAICARCGTDIAATALERYPHWKSLDFARQRMLHAGGDFWQADHIRPLVEANGDWSFFTLDNLQTLCTACHIEKGKEDNRRRKQAREQQMALL